MAGTPPARCRYYDGRVAAGRDAALMLTTDGLLITGLGGEMIDAWPTAEIAPIARDDTGTARLTRAGSAAMVLCDDAALIASLRRAGVGRQVRRGHGGWRLAGWIAGAAAAVVLFFWVGLPFLAGTAARALPEAWERELGARTADQIAAVLSKRKPPFCESPAGRAALDALAARLTASSPPRLAHRVRVADAALPNAFALPGGEVIVLRALIDDMEHPNELAAVLAHEFAHADLRHPTEIAIKTGAGAFAIGLLLGDVFGTSAAVVVGQVLLSAGYTREAEAAADGAMVETLRKAGLAGAPAAAFFDRLSRREGTDGGPPALLQTHPASTDRAAALRALAAGESALSDRQWREVKAICGEKREER